MTWQDLLSLGVCGAVEDVGLIQNVVKGSRLLALALLLGATLPVVRPAALVAPICGRNQVSPIDSVSWVTYVLLPVVVLGLLSMP